jgi:hypothetical protein
VVFTSPNNTVILASSLPEIGNMGTTRLIVVALTVVCLIEEKARLE